MFDMTWSLRTRNQVAAIPAVWRSGRPLGGIRGRRQYNPGLRYIRTPRIVG
jgi:hypothetical protein